MQDFEKDMLEKISDSPVSTAPKNPSPRVHALDQSQSAPVAQKSQYLGWFLTAAILSSIFCAICASFFVSVVLSKQLAERGSQITPISAQAQPFVGLVKKIAPSAVSIYTIKNGSYHSAGSGFIVSEDGYVITNRHIAAAGEDFEIVLNDGSRTRSVSLKGLDPANDLAVLKINTSKKLTPIKLGDSTKINLGESVLAIGNSLGEYENTVTSGIISGQGRAVSAKIESDQEGGDVENLNGLLQTTAAMSQGNSGGPLINMSGEVIGVNTAIATTGSNLGFAIPINAAKGMIAQIQKKGTFERAYFGVVSHVIDTKSILKDSSLASKKGAQITPNGVIDGGPAAKAGLLPGDIITKINDSEINQKNSIINVLGEYSPGQTIDITIIRGSETKKIKVTLARWPN